MEINTPGISRTGSTRSSKKSNAAFEKVTFSSERSSPVLLLKSPTSGFHDSNNLPVNHRGLNNIPNISASMPSVPKSSAQNMPKSPIYSSQHCFKSCGIQKSPSKNTEKAFSFPQSSQKSDSPTILKNDKIFDFSEISNIQHSGQRSPISNTPRCSPNLAPKSPKSPRNLNYSTDSPTSPRGFTDPHSPSGNNFNFNIKPPPKPKLNQIIRQQYQASRNGSSSSKSSLEYVATTKHPTGDYKSVEYKICNSLESDSQTSCDFPINPDYRCNAEMKRSKHSSIKERCTKQPPCNIRMNPGYEEQYSSNKSINELDNEGKHIKRYRKSTSDLTDLTDEAPNTTATSLSRPSSPRRTGSIKGGLAYLASRRGSRDSIASNMSNFSNEDIGPLNFQNTARGRQRRTSNFLELPGRHYLIGSRRKTNKSASAPTAIYREMLFLEHLNLSTNMR